ncbi:MAG: DUF3365 domain-containing protein [Bacteroidota bacterium]|nr:DUF3365 domain-containing protein [Bacteroidota bacterium]
MKAHIIVLLVLVMTVSCTPNDNSVTEPSEQEKLFIDSIGNTISTSLKLALQKNLSDAIKNQGLIPAIEFCKQEALVLTDEVANSSAYKIELKRTSFKYRNPQNAPDEFEELALKYYEKMILEDSDFSASYIQKIRGDQSAYFYYYQPLKTGSVCIVCHGEPENIDPSIASLLVDKYPNDKAIGYMEGDFRGLIRVKVTPEE